MKQPDLDRLASLARMLGLTEVEVSGAIIEWMTPCGLREAAMTREGYSYVAEKMKTSAAWTLEWIINHHGFLQASGSPRFNRLLTGITE